ncbi:carboxypeptidase-like regulatory domain-containing protein [Rathayibacter sp. YIM 133350]|uniref:carboxypeptidase-like regulatory domain-containing protein n=1 Tax=Rathayibacter sp. YIM 133350 TaxID=3131992 RepID=UPI00307F79E9
MTRDGRRSRPALALLVAALAAVAVIAGPIAAVADDSPSAGVTVSGTLHTLDGAPAAGATVTLSNLAGTPDDHYETIASSSGAFQIAGVADGEYHVMFGAVDGPWVWWGAGRHALGSRILHVAGADVVGVDDSIPRGSIISGIVLRDGTPVAGATVLAEKAGDVLGDDVTAADGTYAVVVGETGSYTLRVSEVSGAFGNFPTPIAVAADGETVAGGTLVMGASSRITGTVRFADGSAAVGADVELMRGGHGMGLGPAFTSTTNASGAFELNGLAAGSYQLRVGPGTALNVALRWYGPTGSSRDATTIVIDADHPGYADVLAEPAGAISGTLTSPVTLPYGASITATPAGGGDEMSQWLRDVPEGTPQAWTLRGLAVGQWIVKASGFGPDEYWNDAADAAAATPVTVVAGQTSAGIRFDFTVPSVLAGSVVTSDGSRVEYGYVGAYSGRPGEAHHVADAAILNGRYRFTELLPGHYILQALGRDSNGGFLRAGRAEVTTDGSVGGAPEVDFVLAPGIPVSGHLVDDATGAAVPFAWVSLSGPWVGDTENVLTGPDGAFAFDAPVVGSYGVRSSARNYDDATASLVLGDAGTSDLLVRMHRTIPIPPRPQLPDPDALVGASGGGLRFRGASPAPGKDAAIQGVTPSAGYWVTVFSTPVSLGRLEADPFGWLVVPLPSGLPSGTHTVVLQDDAGTVVGWLTFVVAEPAGGGNGDPGSVAGPAPVVSAPVGIGPATDVATATAAARGSGIRQLSETGAAPGGGIVLALVALLLLLLAVRRARRAPRRD